MNVFTNTFIKKITTMKISCATIALSMLLMQVVFMARINHKGCITVNVVLYM